MSNGATSTTERVGWKDPRFDPAIDAVRASCGVTGSNREDDPMIGMLLDRFSWNHDKVVEMYNISLKKRKELGIADMKSEIVKGNLGLQQLPYADSVRQVIRINGSVGLDKPVTASSKDLDVIVDGKSVSYGDVIGCYEMRYGHRDESHMAASSADAAPGAATESADEPLSPQQFAKYMTYVTQWRWLQCENYIRRHGELGFWAMIHDISCPAGYMSLWSRMRSLLGQYMPPVEDACAGLFPPMVQKILIINVPRLFAPAWSVISRLLPQHHKDRIVLLTTSKTSAEEVGKFVPDQHLPPHLKQGRPDGPD